MAINKLKVGALTVKVSKNQRPFNNNFMQVRAELLPCGLIAAVVRCTDKSNEPGRFYSCMYTLAGHLDSCQC
jgi:hypothetical protein